MVNTRGRIGAEYDWVENRLGNKLVMIPKVRLKKVNGIVEPVGGQPHL